MSAIFRALLFSQETPNNLGLICRKEFTDLRDSTIKDFERYTSLKVNEQSKEVKLKNGSTIMFRHAEELDTLKNINLGWFWIEQAEELNTEEQWFYLLGRLRRESKRRSGWITANVNGHNWIYKHWKERQHTEDYELTEATTYDNKHNLPEDFIKSLDSIPEIIKKRFVLNDWSIAEGLVWPEFKEDIHTCDSYEIPSDWKEVIALDHGYDHPTSVLFGAMNYDGKLIIYGEHYEREKLVSYHAERIKQIEPEYARMLKFIDPSCRNKTLQSQGRIYSIIDEYQDYGITFTPANNDWQAGVNRVGEYFKTNRVVIFKNKCQNLIREIKNYKYKAQRPGQEKIDERPIKLNDDTCFPKGTLILTNKGELNIEEVMKGDKVWTPFGWSPVLEAASIGEKDIYSVNGFKATPNHKIFTSSGFVRLDSLRYYDKIYLCQKPYTLEEYRLGDIQTHSVDQIGSIFNHLRMRSLEARLNFYTDMFGKLNEDLFPKNISSIISMEIPSIMKFQTLNVFPQKSMQGDIEKIGLEIGKKDWQSQEKKQKNGTSLLLEEFGTESMQLIPGRIENFIEKFAQSVQEITALHFPQDQNFVTPIVEPQLCGVEEVYNLTTLNGCYFANGVLVSNCDTLRYLIMSRPQIPIKPKPRSKDRAMPLAYELLEGDPVKPGLSGWLAR